MSPSAARWAPPALALTLVAGTGVAAIAADHPELRRDRSLSIVVPRDGASVDSGFLLAWSASGESQQSFAVLIDSPLPPPRGAAVPGPTTIIVRGTALRLTLGPREGGSPSARHWHEISVIPLDANDFRVGEAVATVRVRDGSP